MAGESTFDTARKLSQALPSTFHRTRTVQLTGGATADAGVGFFRSPNGIVIWTVDPSAGNTTYETVVDGTHHVRTETAVRDQRGAAIMASRFLRGIAAGAPEPAGVGG